jgi:hypothetical protein
MRMRPMQVSWFYLVNVKTGEKVSLDDSLAYFWVEPY